MMQLADASGLLLLPRLLLLLPLLVCRWAAEADEVLIIGGKYSGWSVQVYDPKASVKGRIINGSSIEHVRLNHVGVLLHNSTILIIGGRDMITKQRLNSTALMNINGNAAVFKRGPDMKHRRSGASAAVLAGEVWVCGGVEGKGRRCPLDTCEVLDRFATKFTDKPRMLQQRGGLVLLPLGGKLYAVGGESWQGRCFRDENYIIYNTAEVYDPAKGNWSLIAPMKQPRFLHTGTVWREKLYICGGSGGSTAGLDNGGILNSCEVYDPASNVWTELAAMERPRFGFGMVVLNDKLYALGGSSIPYAKQRYHSMDTTLYSVEELAEPSGAKWRRLSCGLLSKTYAPSVTVIGDAEYRTLAQIAASAPPSTFSSKQTFLSLAISATLVWLFSV